MWPTISTKHPTSILISHPNGNGMLYCGWVYENSRTILGFVTISGPWCRWSLLCSILIGRYDTATAIYVVIPIMIGGISSDFNCWMKKRTIHMMPGVISRVFVHPVVMDSSFSARFYVFNNVFLWAKTIIWLPVNFDELLALCYDTDEPCSSPDKP